MAADAPQNQASPLHVDAGESREACHSTHTHAQAHAAMHPKCGWPRALGSCLRAASLGASANVKPRRLGRYLCRHTSGSRGSLAGEPSATLSTPSSSRGCAWAAPRRLSVTYAEANSHQARQAACSFCGRVRIRTVILGTLVECTHTKDPQHNRLGSGKAYWQTYGGKERTAGGHCAMAT